MDSVRDSSAVWRSTFQTLRQDFHQGAEAFPDLQHAILQALEEEGAIPPRFEREMREAGGWSEGKLRDRWEIPATAEDSAPRCYLEWLALNSPAKRSYLFGDPRGRSRFETLAKRAWLALPGTTDGKAQAYPQPRLLERWLAFVYKQLRKAPSSYLSVDEDLLVCDYTKRGRRVEHRFRPGAVKDSDFVSTGYPDAVGLSRRARRWIYTALATDPFTASTVAIDMLLARPDKEGPVLVSLKGFAPLHRSPAIQGCDPLDYIILGEGRRFEIYSDWCKPVPGSMASVCPNADPPADEPGRKMLLSCLPEIAKRFHSMQGQTIHWVGRQASLGTVCTCFRKGVQGSKPEQEPGTRNAPDGVADDITEQRKPRMRKTDDDYRRQIVLVLDAKGYDITPRAIKNEISIREAALYRVLKTIDGYTGMSR